MKQELALVQPREKLVFTNVTQAREALLEDRLGCVYRRADKVFVVTDYGSGVFSAEDWDR